LYRQSEIYAREGVELVRSTLADWVGGTSRLLAPLVEELRRRVIASHKIHGCDAPVPVLEADRIAQL
jgi:transposase